MTFYIENIDPPRNTAISPKPIDLYQHSFQTLKCFFRICEKKMDIMENKNAIAIGIIICSIK